MITDQAKAEIDTAFRALPHNQPWDEVKAEFYEKLDKILWEDQTRRWNEALKKGAKG